MRAEDDDDDMQSEVLGDASTRLHSARSTGTPSARSTGREDEDEKRPLHTSSQQANEETDLEEEYDADGMPISQLPEAIALARFKREAIEEEDRAEIARIRKANKVHGGGKGGKASRQRQR